MNELLQFKPAVTDTVDPDVEPAMEPFPEILQAYVVIPAVPVYIFPVIPGHNWFAPVIEQEGKLCTVTVAEPDCGFEQG